MGIFQTDLIFFTAIQSALADIRKNLYLVDDMYACLLSDPLLYEKYGQKELEKLKNFIKNVNIEVSISHRIEQAKFPAIAIELGSGNEDVNKAALGDSFGASFVEPESLGGAYDTPYIILGPVTPISYDATSKVITFDDNVDLSSIFPGQYVFDEINRKSYLIEEVDTRTLKISAGVQPNLTNMTVRPTQSNNISVVKRSIWVWESVTLVYASTDATELLYLHTLMIYILGRYKKTLFENRNFAVSTIGYGPVERLTLDSDPNIAWMRSISVRGRVEHSWIESTLPIIDGIAETVKIADMQSADAILDQVKNQNWEE